MQEQLVMTSAGYERLRAEIKSIESTIKRLNGEYSDHVRDGRQEETQDPGVTVVDEDLSVLRRRLQDKREIYSRARPCERTPEQCESCVHIDTFVLLEVMEYADDGSESEPQDMIIHVVGYGEVYRDAERGVEGTPYVAPFLTNLLNQSVGYEDEIDLPNGRTLWRRIKQLSNSIEKLEEQMTR
jgi:hypothetical protein